MDHDMLIILPNDPRVTPHSFEKNVNHIYNEKKFRLLLFVGKAKYVPSSFCEQSFDGIILFTSK